MTFAEVRHTLLRDFVHCVERGQVPPVSAYLAEYVQPGCSAEPSDFRLVPLTPCVIRFANTSSNCLTDGMWELQSKYQQFVADDFGGHVEKGSRDLAVIGFNVVDGVVLDVQEIEQTCACVDWAEPILATLDWQGLLLRALVEYGRFCRATQIRLAREFEAVANAHGFDFAPQLNCYVRDFEHPQG